MDGRYLRLRLTSQPVEQGPHPDWRSHFFYTYVEERLSGDFLRWHLRRSLNVTEARSPVARLSTSEHITQPHRFISH